MKKPNLENRQLDRIIDKSLKARVLENERLETIANRPQLINSIMAEIRTEKAHYRTSSLPKTSVFSFWNNQRLTFAFGCITLFFVAAVSLIYYKNPTLQKLPDENNQVAQIKADDADKVISANEINSNNKDIEEHTKTFSPAVRPIKQKVINKKVSEPPRKSPKPTPIERETLPAGSVFYPLALAGNLSEEAVTRVIRVELTPANLFAMGVNPPIRGAEETITTDLVIGFDGVPRAFRFVSKNSR